MVSEAFIGELSDFVSFHPETSKVDSGELRMVCRDLGAGTGLMLAGIERVCVRGTGRGRLAIFRITYVRSYKKFCQKKFASLIYQYLPLDESRAFLVTETYEQKSQLTYVT